jgi:hypothetical protein
MPRPTDSARQGFSRLYLDKTYPIPKWMLTSEEWDRWHHRDLDRLSEAQLKRERRLSEHRLDRESDRRHYAWLSQHVAAIDAE